MGGPDDHVFNDDNEYDQEDEYDPMDECGLMHDGQCSQAGTEHCDFSCPMRDSAQFVGSKAWREKRRKKSKQAKLDL
jgi:hypothetical protein